MHLDFGIFLQIHTCFFFHFNIRNSLWNYSSWKFHLLCSLISKMTYKYEALPKQIKLNVLHVLIRIHVLNLSEKIHLFLLSFKQSFCWHLCCVLVVTVEVVIDCFVCMMYVVEKTKSIDASITKEHNVPWYAKITGRYFAAL